MSRTDVIKRAVCALLDARRAELDAAADLYELTLELKFDGETWEPRSMIDHITRERRRQPRTKTA